MSVDLASMSDSELSALRTAVEAEIEKRRRSRWTLTEEERAMTITERAKSIRWRLGVDLRTAVEIARRAP